MTFVVLAIFGAATACVAGFGVAAYGLALALLAAVVYASSDRAHQRRRRQAERARLRQRRELRELRFEDAGGCRAALADLTTLVDRTLQSPTRDVPAEDLEELLDMYAQTCIAELTYARQLVRAPVTVCEMTPKHQRAVRTSTLDWLRECAEHARTCRERQEQIADLIRLYVERATTPEIHYLIEDDLIDRQLSSLSAERG